MEVDAHEELLAAVEAEEVDAEEGRVAEISRLIVLVLLRARAPGVKDAVEDLRLFAAVDVGEPRPSDERGGVHPRLASHLALDRRARQLRGQPHGRQRPQGTIKRLEQKLHVFSPADGRGVFREGREVNTVRVSPRIERRRGGALVDRGVALVDAPGAAERVRRGARGRDARVRVRWARGRVTRTQIRRPAPQSRPHGVHAPGFTRAREPGDAHGRHRLPRRARHRSDANRVRCVCAPRFWEAPIFSRDVGVQRESSAERYARGL